jgi:AraC family transcriptional regulator of adaptative response / DNA-3-methyladenine glycosylase II
VRRFNETFHQLFQRPPSALRHKLKVALPDGSVGMAGVAVRLRYRPPYDWTAMLGHLRARAIDGVEHVDGTTYRRTVVHEGRVGTVEVSHLPDLASLQASIRLSHLGALLGIVGRLRRVLDLGTDAASIEAHLAQDPFLAPLIAARPGLRVPGGWDGFEIGARAVLGQQVSLGAGVRLAGQLALLCGPPIPTTHGGHERLTRAFPSAAEVLGADLRSLSVPAARRRALVSLAEAAIADPDLFQPLDTVEQTVARLESIRGVGTWTAHYIALRGAREPDAFPASDLGLLRTAARRHGATLTPAALERCAERWRPWRGYAAQHLWASDAAAPATPEESGHARVHASAS